MYLVGTQIVAQTQRFELDDTGNPLFFVACAVVVQALFGCTKLEFFHYLSIILIFSRLHEILNVGKKITNYTV
jgi:hypothetical protein